VTWDAFCKLVVFGTVADIEAAIAQHPELVRGTGEHGFTALHVLMTEERFEVAALLLRAGADVDAVDDSGHTPLHLVQDRRVLQVLLRHGANLEARGTRGDTPLISHAVEGPDTGSHAILSALLEAGADAEARDVAGHRAVDYARQRGEPDKVRLLATARTTGRFADLQPSSLDPLACAITLQTAYARFDATIEAALEPGVVGVSFLDGTELWFAIYSSGRLREVVQAHEAIASAREHRLAVWTRLDPVQARELRWPGAMLDVVEKLHAAGRHREALPLIDRMLSLVPSFEATLGSTGIHRSRQVLLQKKVVMLLDVEDFAPALACITESALRVPILEARALAGLSRYDEAAAAIERMPPTREGARLAALWRAAKPMGFTVGGEVTHPKFGRGAIVALEAGKARVRFADQERTLQVSFLKPA